MYTGCRALDLTQIAIDKSTSIAFVAVFLYAAFEAYLAFGFGMRGSFDDLDTFITKARFLAIMIMDKKNAKHHDNNAFYPTCAPNPQ